MYPPHHFGGYEIVWQSAVEHLRARGHHVRVLTTDTRTGSPDAEDEKDVHRELRWTLRDGQFEPLGLRGGLDLARHNHSKLMLERHGIVTRETVLSEGIPGGFSTLYGELGNLELLGTARRGYFVEGMGGAQFALPGAVERLRSLPAPDGSFLVLAATDPANP